MHVGSCPQGLITTAPWMTPGQLQVSELEQASGSACGEAQGGPWVPGLQELYILSSIPVECVLLV